MKISIVTAYYNRKQLLINTLNSIVKSQHDDYEFIIVDDASDEEHRIEDLLIRYPFIKLIRVNREDKWYFNPCIPFNMGFKKASGEIILIQNPECLHVGDILKYTNNNLQIGNYFSYSCYSVDLPTTQKFSTYDLTVNEILNNVPLYNKSVTSDGEMSWYNHPYYRPVGYHFCSAITKKDLIDLDGFDEKYAWGIGYDDDDFLRRVKGKLNFQFVENPFVIHQYHYNISNNYKIEDAQNKLNRNKNLYLNGLQ